MRYFTYSLSCLAKPFLAIVPLALFCALSCPSAKQQRDVFHPIWFVYNGSEDGLPSDKCLITKFGLDSLRFHVTDHQKCFNTNENDFYSASEKNIIETKPKAVNVVLTPNFFGTVTSEKFPETMKKRMKYRAFDDKEGGMPLSFLTEWLAIDDYQLDDFKDTILILSTGIEGKLGVSDPLKNELKGKKEKGEIADYRILKSGEALMAHNRYVKEGKKVFTFIHTAG